MDFTSHAGQRPFLDVGSYLAVTAIEAPPFTKIYSLWYRQTFADNKAWLLVGQSDAFDNFTTIPRVLIYQNPGYSTLPTLPFFPTYPNPSMSVIGSWSLRDNLSIKLGVFTAIRALGVPFIPGVARPAFRRFVRELHSSALIIGEIDWTWAWRCFKGKLEIGGWQYTLKFPVFQTGHRRVTAGPYVTLDQTIYKSDDEDAAVFLIYGWGDPSLNPVNNYVGMGFTWTGMFADRPNDTFGVGMSRVMFTDQAIFTRPDETSYELVYQWWFSPWGFLAPDFQYIVSPGGRGLPNAYVFTIRLHLTL